MEDQEVKVRENRLRRAAARQGLRLAKTRRFDPLASDYGTYRIVAADGTDRATALALDDVERWLLHPDQRA